MRSVGLSVTGTLLSFYAAGVSAQAGVACDSSIAAQTPWNAENTVSVANDVCNTHLNDEGASKYVEKESQDGLLLSITKVEDSTLSSDECVDRFVDILKQCSGDLSGTTEVDGRLYEIYKNNVASSHEEEKRAPKAKTTKKTTTKAATTKASSTKAAEPTTTSSSKSSSSSKASSSSSSASSTAKPSSSSAASSSSKASSSAASSSKASSSSASSASNTASSSGSSSSKASSSSGASSSTKASSSSGSASITATSSGASSSITATSSGMSSITSSRNSTSTIKSSSSKSMMSSSSSASAQPTDACAWSPGKRLSARSTCGEDEWSRIEANADPADLTNGCTGKGAKGRSIEALEAAARSSKRSGDAFAVMWDKWEEVLKKLDEEFGKVLAAAGAGSEKVTIIWAGGISGIRLKSRGAKGKTGDIDYAYHTSTSADLKAQFKVAIDETVKQFPELNQKQSPISNSLEFRASAAKVQKWTELADKNGNVVYDGKNLKAVDGDWLLQVFGKMTRMYQMRLKRSNQDIKANRPYGQYKPRDQQDAKVFFKQAVAANGDVSMKDLLEIGKVWERDADYVEAMVTSTMKLINPDLSNVDAKIKELANKVLC